MKETQVKSGRGRKVGSYCFSPVTLSELCSKLDGSMTVMVSSKWLAAVGIQPSAPARKTTDAEAPASIQPSEPALVSETIA